MHNHLFGFFGRHFAFAQQQGHRLSIGASTKCLGGLEDDRVKEKADQEAELDAAAEERWEDDEPARLNKLYLINTSEIAYNKSIPAE